MGKFRAKAALGQIVFSAFAPRNTQIYFGDISGELEIGGERTTHCNFLI